jgi:hypothetical protein
MLPQIQRDKTKTKFSECREILLCNSNSILKYLPNEIKDRNNSLGLDRAESLQFYLFLHLGYLHGLGATPWSQA